MTEWCVLWYFMTVTMPGDNTTKALSQHEKHGSYNIYPTALAMFLLMILFSVSALLFVLFWLLSTAENQGNLKFVCLLFILFISGLNNLFHVSEKEQIWSGADKKTNYERICLLTIGEQVGLSHALALFCLGLEIGMDSEINY